MLHIPVLPFVLGMLLVALLFITAASYRLTQSIMLLVSLFYIAYVISAFKARPDWGLALSNLIFPHGVTWTATYARSYLIIGMGVLGTTITPWGQFFVSSFAFDKKIDKDTLRYSQLETYLGCVPDGLLLVLHDRRHGRHALHSGSRVDVRRAGC